MGWKSTQKTKQRQEENNRREERKKAFKNRRRLNKIKGAETSLEKGQKKKQIKIIKLIGTLSMKP